MQSIPKVGQTLTGSMFSEPMRIESAIPISNGTWRLGLVGAQSERFRSVTLSSAELSTLDFRELTFSFAGDGDLLRLGIQAYSLGIAFEFDPYFGLSVSRVDPLPHQLEAIYDSMLKLPRVRFLLADDAGAGKTVMAGLLLRELKLRGLADRTLIVCPANLTFQWQRELKDKFDEVFTVMRGFEIRAQYGVNQWLQQKQLITSLDLAKRDDVLPSLHQANWDLVIVDEAQTNASLRIRRMRESSARSAAQRNSAFAPGKNELAGHSVTCHSRSRQTFQKRAIIPTMTFAAPTQTTVSCVSWDAFFRILRRELNGFAIRNWPLPKDRSGPERTLGWRRLFDLFPVATDVIVFDTQGVDVRFNQTGLATAIRYDLSRPKTLLVRDHGIIPLRDFDAHATEIQAALALDEETLPDVKKLTFSAITGYPDLLHIVQYDARTNVTEYVQDFLTLLSTSHLPPLFEMSFDFNTKYDLRPSPILSEPELLAIDEVMGCFFRGDRSEQIKKAQENVASIKLIPQVPPEIGRLIHSAKRLYVFGLFEYEFFTISQHYAYLAVEAALYHRWSAEQSKPLVLTHGTETLTIHDSGRDTIVYICENKAWDRKHLRVNGKRFPFTNAALLRQLRAAAVITEWQYNDLRYWLRKRNSHSHREFGPLEMPDPGVIQSAVEIVNSLFDAVTLPPK